MELPADLFAVPWNADMVHQVITSMTSVLAIFWLTLKCAAKFPVVARSLGNRKALAALATAPHVLLFGLAADHSRPSSREKLRPQGQ